MAIITIGGNLGAGKTTLAPKLAAALSYEELYVGGIFRDMAAERGMTIEDFYADIKSDPLIDRAVDERQAKLMHEKDNVIVQGRIAWFFADHLLKINSDSAVAIVDQPNPFRVIHILLTVDPLIGAQRVAERKENIGLSQETVARNNAIRIATERERYKTLYNIPNAFDPAHYTLTLDTSNLTPEEVFSILFQKISAAL